MRRGEIEEPCEQCKLFLAVEKGDSSLIEHSFTLHDSKNGHYEAYGYTYSGAAACYILRFGSPGEITRRTSQVVADGALAERVYSGIWNEFPRSIELYTIIFENANAEVRMDMLEIILIEKSEGVDVSKLMEKLISLEIRNREKRKVDEILKFE